MTATALEAFLHEYRPSFPVGIDVADGKGPPRTFRARRLGGTPSVLLFDRGGTCRLHALGHVEDIRLGAAIATTLDQPG